MERELVARGSAIDHLELAATFAHLGIWELDTATGEAWRNLKHDQLFGYEEKLESWTYDDFLGHVVDEDRERVDELYSAALADGEEWAFECRILRTDGLTRWISAHGRPLEGGDGKPERLIGHVIDITDTKRNEEHLRLVTAELNHRLQNIIASISGLIALSARGGGDRIENAKVLQERLKAIGRSHNMAYNTRTERVAVREVYLSERSTMPELSHRVVIDIDERLTIQPQVAERLMLVVHELGTNAVKYGALSNETGRIVITSRVLENGDVELMWTETGGPEASAPERKGFGTRLIQTSLSADAHVEMNYPSKGATCRIVLPSKLVSATLG